MSTLTQHSIKSAQTFNKKASSSIWGRDLCNIPNITIDYPGLANFHESTEFVKGVKNVQRDLGLIEDGKLGRGTWTAILKQYEPVEDSDSFWTIDDRRHSCFTDPEVEFVNFDQPGGLDLHRFGHFSSRKGKPIRLIVVHWGGLNPHHCYRVFSDPNRKVSSHAGIGLSDTGEPTIYQYLDLNHKSWHAGWANGTSVGIDICQQPGLKWESRYSKAPYDVSRIDNPTDRGPSEILSIDPGVAKATRHAINTLCVALNIPKVCPRGPKGESDSGEIYHGVVDKDFLLNEFTGVIGHHHISPNKWDCACWWDQIW